MQPAASFVPPEAPVFRPTPEEYEHPLRYIASIRPVAEAYGICKVIPPAGWKPPYVLNRESFRFKTRIQSVHELQERPDCKEAADLFQDDFTAFLQTTGRPVRKPPIFAGTPIDLAQLYKVVLRRGGYDIVTRNKGWRDVGRILQVGRCSSACNNAMLCQLTYVYAVLQLDDKSNNAAYTLRQVYQKHLLAYEKYDRERETTEAAECPPANSGSKATKRCSEPRDDAEEAADILNAIMGLSSLPEHAPPAKRAKSVGMVRDTALEPTSALNT